MSQVTSKNFLVLLVLLCLVLLWPKCYKEERYEYVLLSV